MGRLNVGQQLANQQQANVVAEINAPIVDTAEYNSLTREIIELYNLDQQQKTAKTMCDAKKSDVLTKMKNLKMDNITVNGVKCSAVERKNKSIDQEALLKYCKSLKIKGLVKRVEVVDLDVLENLTYNRQIDPAEIEKFTTVTVSESIRLSGKPKQKWW